MRYTTHVAGGVALGYLLINNIDAIGSGVGGPKEVMIATAGLIIGSLMPDIDIKTSYMSRKTRLVSFFTSKVFKHRGFTHSIVGTLSMGILLYFLMSALSFSRATIKLSYVTFMIGVASHIILDIMTHSGVELLYPYNKRISLGRFSINKIIPLGMGEFMVAVLLSVVAYRNMQILL